MLAITPATDLFDSPAQVKALCDRVSELWFRYYAGQYDLVRDKMEGTSAWMGIWSPGRWYPIQCDFSALISPRMFEEFALPYLAEQCRWLDNAIYHWDGPGQIPHLDLLLQIKELNGIQWVPGAGNEPTGSPKWFPLYRRILAAGKNLVLCEVAPERVEPLIQELGPRGLLIQTACRTEEEADALLKRAAS